MSLSIHTNFASLVTQNTLNKNNSLLSTAMQRLGTGFRINSAADDAAGLQIATRLSAQSRGMSVAQRNAQDAISLLQTAEGAFSEMTDIVQRMKDLATQGANGTNSAEDRAALQAEYDELGKELANVIKNTKYAGENLFSDGTAVDGTAGKFANAVVFQIGASGAETLSLDVSGDGGELKKLATALTGISQAYKDGTKGSEIVAADGDAATTKIDSLETALDDIGALRAKFGANINRLEHTANNLANMQANTDMAKGRIMDADFAAESSVMTKQQMLMQSGISVLGNSNQLTGLVASLLR